jgi:predicted SAM-dependent methyltransferase
MCKGVDMEKSKKLKLNLGCGKRILPTYVNIDSKPFKDLVEVMDVRNLQYADNSVDEILAEFILEHISYYEIQETIWEWWRVLKPKGILILLVPDFEEIAKTYLRGELGRETLHFQLYSPVINPERQMPHLCTFDKSYLNQLLTREGFEIQSMENIGTDVKVVAKKIVCKEGILR